MAFEDFVEPEVAITAAVTAAIFSPRARKVMRKGLVYGVAGILTAGDAIATFTRGVGQGIQHASERAAHMAQEMTHGAREMVKENDTSTELEMAGIAQGKSTTEAEEARSTEDTGGQYS